MSMWMSCVRVCEGEREEWGAGTAAAAEWHCNEFMLKIEGYFCPQKCAHIARGTQGWAAVSA